MHIDRIHTWDITYKEAMRLQSELSARIKLTRMKKIPKIVAGADIAYSKRLNLSFGVVALFEFPALEQINVYSAYQKTNMPYIPGLLSFREAPVLLSIFEQVEENIDLIMIDGQGIAHPRGLGLASHIGIFLETPTIGCAKSRLVGEHKDIDLIRGNKEPVNYKDKLCAYVVCTRDNVKPLYISPGHLIDFQGACEYVLKCSDGFRLPKPTRIADQLVAEYKKQIIGQINKVIYPP
ncbi:endonuclease V [bacterium]|nr:endonuclease V [bacterium]